MNLANIDLHILYTALYMGAYFVSGKKDLGAAWLALISCQCVSISPLFSHLDINNPGELFSAYTLPYVAAAVFIRTFITRSLCFIMSCITLILAAAYKHGASFAGIEVWLYVHYEFAVTCIHVGICFSLVQRSKLRSVCGDIYNFILHDGSIIRRALHI